MTLDERIEALTQSLELLAGMHREMETRHVQFEQVVSDAIGRLARIAIDHERRLNNLEGGGIQ